MNPTEVHNHIMSLANALQKRRNAIRYTASELCERLSIDTEGRAVARALWDVGTFSNWRAVESWLDHRFPEKDLATLPHFHTCARALRDDLKAAGYYK